MSILTKLFLKFILTIIFPFLKISCFPSAHEAQARCRAGAGALRHRWRLHSSHAAGGAQHGDVAELARGHVAGDLDAPGVDPCTFPWKMAGWPGWWGVKVVGISNACGWWSMSIVGMIIIHCWGWSWISWLWVYEWVMVALYCHQRLW